MSTRAPERLWRLGMKNALMVGLVMLVTCAVLASVVGFFVGWGFGRSLGLAFVVVYAVVVASFFVTLARDRASAGRLLYDAGKHPQRRLFLFNAGVSFLIALTAFLGPSQSGNLFMRLLPYFLLTGAVFNFYQSFGRLQVREAGLWGYWGLLPWRKIGSYSWTNDATLLVQTSGRLSFLRGGFAVPPEHRANLEAYLLEHTRQSIAR